MIIHTVQQGETMAGIAAQYGVPLARLIRDNAPPDPDRLVPGQTLVVLFPQMTHVVEAGDTIFNIARDYRISVNQIYRNNPQLHGSSLLLPGQRLVITYEQTRLGSLEINGYAYPFIQKSLLRDTMPYMTYITPFSYEITDTGALWEPDDSGMIAMAESYRVSPMMNLSNLTREGHFSSSLASLVLNHAQIQNRVIEETMQIIRTKGYRGLDVDFEYVLAEDGDNYIVFLKRLADLLNPVGCELMTALAPKISPDQRGLLYEGHNYRKIGQVVNGALLMTYEWGYRNGPPMAISPIGNVRAVLDYAVTEIPPEKIFVGIPNYGYDWTLPNLGAKSISNIEAVELASQYGATIHFDNASQAPHFRYFDESEQEHEVWFEDAKSIRAKLALVSEYGIRGAGYWNLMRPFPQNWRVLNALYGIRQM